MGDTTPDIEKNIFDAKAFGAQAIVYFCPVCKSMLESMAQKHELPLIFLGDIVRMAIGELELQI